VPADNGASVRSPGANCAPARRPSRLIELQQNRPKTRADAKAPTKIAYCCNFGVPPTRKPVFRSCEVVPPLEAAMQTTAPDRQRGDVIGAPRPANDQEDQTGEQHVATVMPEMGFEEEPISPVSREETVTKQKPKSTMSSAPSRFICSGRASVMAVMSATTRCRRTSSVGRDPCAAPPSLLRPASGSAGNHRAPRANPCQMVGSDRKTLMIPPAATAPPRYRARTPRDLIRAHRADQLRPRGERARQRFAEEFDHRNQHQVGEHPAGTHDGTDSRTDDITHAEEFGRDFDSDRAALERSAEDLFGNVLPAFNAILRVL